MGSYEERLKTKQVIEVDSNDVFILRTRYNGIVVSELTVSPSVLQINTVSKETDVELRVRMTGDLNFSKE